jgi:hypothetical protein
MKKTYPTSGNDNLCLMHAIFGNRIDQEGKIYYTNAKDELKDCQKYALEQIQNLVIPSDGFNQFVNEGHWNDVIIYLNETKSSSLGENDTGIKEVSSDQYIFLTKHQYCMDTFSKGKMNEKVEDYICFTDNDYITLSEEDKTKLRSNTEEQIKQYKTYEPETIIKNVLVQVAENINKETIGNHQPYIPFGRFIAKKYQINLSLKFEGGPNHGTHVSYIYRPNMQSEFVEISYNGFSHFSKKMEGEDYDKLPKDKYSMDIDTLLDKQKHESYNRFPKDKYSIDIDKQRLFFENQNDENSNESPLDKNSLNINIDIPYDNLNSKKKGKEALFIISKDSKSSNIFLNSDHPLVKSKSISNPEVEDFFKQHGKNLNINEWAEFYQKITKKQNEILSLTAKDIAVLSNMAKFIFQDFKKEEKDKDKKISFYENIEVCGNQITSLLNGSILTNTTEKIKDALFAVKLYNDYLVKCYVIKEKMDKADDKRKLKEELEQYFNTVFSSDLTACAGGIGSAFTNALSGGVNVKIFEEYGSKMARYIPEAIEAHLRPFIVNMISEKTDDAYMDSIQMYFTDKEFKEFISKINSGNFFTLFAKDVIAIWEQLKSLDMNECRRVLSMMTEDHYLFAGNKPILDSLCLMDTITFKALQTEKEVLDAVATQFLEKGFFKKQNNLKIAQSQEVLTALITSSYKNPNLFFYCQALDADLLDNRGNIVDNALNELIKLSNGSQRFKEFSIKQLKDKIKQVVADKTLNKLIHFVHDDFSLNEKSNNLFDDNCFDVSEITPPVIVSLISHGIPSKKLIEIINSVSKKRKNFFSKFHYNISILCQHPEATEISIYLSEKKVEIEQELSMGINLLIKNRNFGFLDTLLNLYPTLFSNIELKTPNSDDYLSQRLEFMMWIGSKIESDVSNKKLIPLIIQNSDFVFYAIIRRSFRGYLVMPVFKLMLKYAAKTELILFFNKTDSNGFGPLSYLIRTGADEFSTTIKLLLSKEIDVTYLTTWLQSTGGGITDITNIHLLAFKAPEQFVLTVKLLIDNKIGVDHLENLLGKIVSKGGGLPFHFIAEKGPEQFLEVIKLLRKYRGDMTIVRKFIGKEDVDKCTPLYFLATYGPKQFFELIKFLVDDKIGAADLKALLEVENKNLRTPFGILAEKDPEQFLGLIKLLVDDKIGAADLKALLDVENKKIMSPFYILAEKDPEQFLGLIKLLREKAGIEVLGIKKWLQKASDNGNSILHFFAFNAPKQFFGLIKFLVDDKIGAADLKALLEVENKNQKTPFYMLGVKDPEQFLGLIKLLVDDKIGAADLKALLDVENKGLLSPFYMLADKDPEQFLGLIKLLREKAGIEVLGIKKWLQKAGDNGNSILHSLAFNAPKQFFGLIKFLVDDKIGAADLKALLEVENKKLKTPFYMLAEKDPEQFLGLIKLLREKAVIEVLDIKKWLQSADSAGQDILHLMAFSHPKQFLELIKLLVDEIGADDLKALLEALNKKLKTPFYYLAEKDPEQFLGLIKLLIKREVIDVLDIEKWFQIKDNCERCIFHVIASNHPKEFLITVKFLLEYGVNEILTLLLKISSEGMNTLSVLEEKDKEEYQKVYDFIVDKGWISRGT